MAKVNYNYYNVTMVSSISEMMELALKEAPNRIAYKYKVGDEIRSLTFSSFIDRVYSLGAFLTSKGESAGRIACLGSNSISWITAYFTALRFVVPLIKRLYGSVFEEKSVNAVTAFNISSNHGREEFIPVKLEGSVAHPIFRKSGVISLLCEADGYTVIDRNKEGLKKSEEITVHLF